MGDQSQEDSEGERKEPQCDHVYIAEHELDGIQGSFFESAVRDSEAHGEAIESHQTWRGCEKEAKERTLS